MQGGGVWMAGLAAPVSRGEASKREARRRLRGRSIRAAEEVEGGAAPEHGGGRGRGRAPPNKSPEQGFARGGASRRGNCGRGGRRGNARVVINKRPLVPVILTNRDERPFRPGW